MKTIASICIGGLVGLVGLVLLIVPGGLIVGSIALAAYADHQKKKSVRELNK